MPVSYNLSIPLGSIKNEVIEVYAVPDYFSIYIIQKRSNKTQVLTNKNIQNND